MNSDDYVAILRHDLMSFIERSFYELNPQTELLRAPHLEMIAGKLEDCRRGTINRLIINLPPRQLKSHCASVAFPAWYLAQHPAAHIICASYGQDLADKFARDCRRIMASAWYGRLFTVRLADRHAVHDFATTERGSRMATSVGGVLTGRGADLIIIDDPLKPDEALSESRRNAVNEWYDHTLLTRLNNKERGCIVIIMQRLHQDDLVGHVIEQDDWEILSFPAIAEADEICDIESPLGRGVFKRAAGEILHPERESAATLAHIRRTIGEYNFSAQYQQNPTPLGGAMVKIGWLQYYDPGQCPVRFSQTVQSWDTANKATELSDYSVCTTWGVHENRYYLLDVVRQRLNYPDLKRKVQELAERDRPNRILIEDKASGTQLIQELKAEGLYAVAAYQPPSGTDKIMRLHAQTAVFENGRVLLPLRAPWLAEYINELTSFPGSRYDDQVDSTTQALDHLSTSERANWFKNITPDVLARASIPGRYSTASRYRSTTSRYR
jgi:predicted phage terminase large subunit-like protein